MSKKITSVVLALCMMLSCVVIGSFSSQAATEGNTVAAAATSSTGAGSQDPQDTVQGSAVLHCFNWSYNSIKENLPAIKAAGYTAVQTSPVTPPKDYNAGWTDQKGQWWKLYQPVSISVADGNSWLGTKAELKSMCQEAEKYGIKVIVDIVANHMADVDGSGNHAGNINSGVESEIRNNSSYWHLNGTWANDDNNRYNMTQGSIGQPDLNTSNSYIQQRYKNLLVELVKLGVDGFRFDAAKHIELPTDGNYGSQFWPTVIDGAKSAASGQLYFYGEILNGAGTAISNYTKYINITDNYSGDCTLVSANNRNASGLANSNYSKGAGADKTVLWVESHDTYMGESGTGGLKNTSGVSNDSVVKAWAIVGSRANSTALFFARPHANMGAASSDTTWKSKAVAEVNKFKNYFEGQSEYLASSGDVAYNERGTTGVVISKLSGGGSVSLTANKMQNGTYTDQVSGNQFTVSGGKISGSVGSSGVAVVYNARPAGPTASVTPGSSTYKTDTLTLTLNYSSNATSGQYSIDGGSYKSFTNGQTITIGSGVAYGTKTTVSVKASNGSETSDAVSYTYTKVDPSAVQTVYFDNSSYNWSSVYAYIYDESNGSVVENAAWPGEAMKKGANNIYELEVPENLANGMVIFTESQSATTNRYPADGADGVLLGGKNMIMKANHSWTEYTPVQPTTQPTQPTQATQPTQPTQPTQATQPTTQPIERVLIGDVNLDGKISISDVTEIQMHVSEMKVLTGKMAIAADVDGDKTISVKDATCIQCYLVELFENAGNCGTYIGEEPTTQPTQPTTQPTQPTQPTTQPVGDKIKIYFSSTWSSANCYYWSDENPTMMTWPGTAMNAESTNEYGETIYTLEVPSSVGYLIFNNGGDQTDDYTWSDKSLHAFYNDGGKVTPWQVQPE